MRARASWASTLGSRSPATSAPSIARPDTPKMSEATTESLMQASSSSFSTRFFSRGARGHQIGAIAGQIPQPPDRAGRHETRAQHLPLGHLAQPDGVQRVFSELNRS